MPGEGTTMPPAKSAQSAGDVPVRSIGDTKIAYEILRYVPEESATHYGLVPLGVAEGVLEIGMLDPEDINGIDALNFIARRPGWPFKFFRSVKRTSTAFWECTADSVARSSARSPISRRR